MAKIARLIPETEIDPGVGSGDFWVKVIDYDGTVLLEKRGNNGDSFDLPSAPSHEGLVFQEWSASCPITNGKVVIDNNNIVAGAVYTTASGQNEFDITLTKVTGLSVTLNMDGTKDWGDGTSDTNTTHTYTAYGDYTIKCNGTTMTTDSISGLFGQSNSVANYYCTAVRLATITVIGVAAFGKCCSLTSIIISSEVTIISSSAFRHCYCLTSVTIPSGVTSVGSDLFNSCYCLTSVTIPSGVTGIYDGAFNNCYCLTSATIPSGVTDIRSSAFNNCRSLTSIIIPNGITAITGYMFGNCYSLISIIIPSRVTIIASYAFNNCRSLTSIIIPNGVTDIGDCVFQNCYSITKYDFSQCTAVPKLSNTNVFLDINKIAKIIVPDSLYNTWIAAANWSTYADYIYKASEVTA